MCLEFLNQFLLYNLTWLAFGVFAAIIAALAAISFFTHRDKNQTRGFTCPCYAPPPIPSENGKKM